MNGAQMPPQAPGAAAPEQPQEAGGASQLVVEIQDKMQSLMDMVSRAGLESEKAQLGQLMAGYESLVESLGAAPGAPSGPPAAPKSGTVPMEAGGNKVIPAM